MGFFALLSETLFPKSIITGWNIWSSRFSKTTLLDLRSLWADPLLWLCSNAPTVSCRIMFLSIHFDHGTNAMICSRVEISKRATADRPSPLESNQIFSCKLLKIWTFVGFLNCQNWNFSLRWLNLSVVSSCSRLFSLCILHDLASLKVNWSRDHPLLPCEIFLGIL